MKQQHTPGPWTVDEPNEYHKTSWIMSSSGMIARCLDSSPDSEFNARLIAAAPELLAALEAVYEAGTIAYAAAYCGRQPWPDDRREEFRINHCQADMLARAAIAKAKGNL